MPIERLYIICEGQTEETFVDATLNPYFSENYKIMTIPLLLPNKKGAKQRMRKGGLVRYSLVKNYLHEIMKDKHSDATWFTTMLDLYQLPDDFPGLKEAGHLCGAARVEAIEAAFAKDIKTDAYWRFTPYLQLHEFEALLLVDIGMIGKSFPERPDAAERLRQALGGKAPETINEHKTTAPSKRIIDHFPEYAGQKASAGPLIAGKIGLPRLRQACPHFHAWIEHLERACRRS